MNGFHLFRMDEHREQAILLITLEFVDFGWRSVLVSCDGPLQRSLLPRVSFRQKRRKQDPPFSVNRYIFLPSLSIEYSSYFRDLDLLKKTVDRVGLVSIRLRPKDCTSGPSLDPHVNLLRSQSLSFLSDSLTITLPLHCYLPLFRSRKRNTKNKMCNKSKRKGREGEGGCGRIRTFGRLLCS